jgi:hypothetical protein
MGALASDKPASWQGDAVDHAIAHPRTLATPQGEFFAATPGVTGVDWGSSCMAVWLYGLLAWRGDWDYVSVRLGLQCELVGGGSAVGAADGSSRWEQQMGAETGTVNEAWGAAARAEDRGRGRGEGL